MMDVGYCTKTWMREYYCKSCFQLVFRKRLSKEDYKNLFDFDRKNIIAYNKENRKGFRVIR